MELPIQEYQPAQALRSEEADEPEVPDVPLTPSRKSPTLPNPLPVLRKSKLRPVRGWEPALFARANRTPAPINDETMAKLGVGLPKPLTLPLGVVKLLEEDSMREGVSFAHYVRRIVINHYFPNG